MYHSCRCGLTDVTTVDILRGCSEEFYWNLLELLVETAEIRTTELPYVISWEASSEVFQPCKCSTLQ